MLVLHYNSILHASLFTFLQQQQQVWSILIEDQQVLQGELQVEQQILADLYGIL